jgi:hypothetical protein
MAVQDQIEGYRQQYKKVAKCKDKDFDKLVKSYSDPNHALSYLRGFLNTQVRK